MSYLADFVTSIIGRQCAEYAGLFNRVIADFDDLEARAERVSREEWDRLMSQPVFDDNEGDMGAYAERAQELGQEYYDRMFPLAQTLLNLFALGLYHLFEQQLFLVHQLATRGQKPPRSMHSSFKWMRHAFKIDPATYPIAPRLDELRLVSNVVKHAEGGSANELRAVRAELFQHPAVRGVVSPGVFASSTVRQPLTGESIYISRQGFEDYAAQVDAFWTTLAADLQARNL